MLKQIILIVADTEIDLLIRVSEAEQKGWEKEPLVELVDCNFEMPEFYEVLSKSTEVH